MTKLQESPGPAGRITIDAGELIAALLSHDYEFEYFLDLLTGGIQFLGEDDVVEEDAQLRASIDEDENRFVFIEPMQSAVGWQIMAEFIEQLPFGKVRDRLTGAVQRSKPFRRFKDELLHYPDVRQDWFAFEYIRMLDVARAWLERKGIEADLKTRERA